MYNKKRILLSILGVLVILGTASVALGLTGEIHSSDSSGNYVEEFDADEDVYVVSWGGKDLPDNTYYCVVTTHQDWSGGGMTISDYAVTTVKTLSDEDLEGASMLGTVSNDGGSDDIPHPGSYDIVCEVGSQDDTYDKDTDYAFTEVECGGFTTVPEFGTIAIPVSIALLGALFFFRRR